MFVKLGRQHSIRDVWWTPLGKFHPPLAGHVCTGMAGICRRELSFLEDLQASFELGSLVEKHFAEHPPEEVKFR